MKTLEFERRDYLQLEPEIYALRDRMYNSAKGELESKYGNVNETHLMKELLLISIAMKNICVENPRGLTFLDLGCGSMDSPDKPHDDFSPWLCRCLYQLGGKVIGVDIADNSREEFESIQGDLRDVNILNCLENKSIDVASAFMLIDSPALNKYKPYKVGYNTCEGRKMMNVLEPTIERVVKEKGIFIKYF